MKNYLFIALFWVICGNSYSQNLFTDFTAQQFGNSVFVKWTLKAGNTCFDMQVERETENISFDMIYTVPGLCGATEDLKYEFYDSDLSGGTYRYRITGSDGFYISDTVEVNFIAVGAEDFVVYPNPAVDVMYLGISSELSFPFKVELFDLHGKNVYSVSISSRQLNIPAENLQTGYYFAKVTDDTGYSSYKKVFVQ